MRGIRYRPDIDGLRAIAVLAVLAFHLDPGGWARAGFFGVDIFFVLSGYLITTIIRDELDRGEFSLVAFFARRVRRLAPALLLVQLGLLAVGATVLLPLELTSLAKESLFAQLYVSNIYYWQNLNYFGLQAQHSYLLHSWSLAIEEQFYLILPPVLIAVHRFARPYLFGILIMLGVLSFALAIAFVAAKPEATFYLLPTRMWEFAAGAILPRFERHGVPHPVRRNLAGGIGVAMLAIGFGAYRSEWASLGWFALLPVGGTALIMLAGTGTGSALSRVLAWGPLVWIGKLSYPLYLVHWPVLVFIRTVLPTFGVAVTPALAAIVLPIGWIVYRFELAMRVTSARWSDRRVLLGYAGCVALIVAVSASAWLSHGWRWRFAPEVLRIADQADIRDGGPDHPYFAGPLDHQLRRIGTPRIAPRWLIVGDSHAYAMATPAGMWLRGRGEAGQLAYSAGCVPLFDVGDGHCRRLMRATEAYLQGHREIGAVLLLSLWREAADELRDGDGHILRGEPARRAFAQALHATLLRLKAMGLRVMIWEPLPMMASNVPETLARGIMFGRRQDVMVDQARDAASVAFIRDAIDRDDGLIEGRVAPARAMCRDGLCYGSSGGAPLFLDNNHPAIGEARFFASILATDLHGVGPIAARK